MKIYKKIRRNEMNHSFYFINMNCITTLVDAMKSSPKSLMNSFKTEKSSERIAFTSLRSLWNAHPKR